MKKHFKNIILIGILIILCTLATHQITNQNKTQNIIFMIGDGMGENHILAGEWYKGEPLNMQKISNKAHVTTASTEMITDSAAAATALATGHKTSNGYIGKDVNGKDVQNLTEYAKSKGKKTGIICTQIINHATPAGFTVHNITRENYDEIAKAQIQSDVDLMLGRGRPYFSQYQTEMSANNYYWINDISELDSIPKKEKVIGTFAEGILSEEYLKTTLAEMTTVGLSRLENKKGFFVMIEGSDIDTYSHQGNMNRMLTEILEFDDAVGVAMEYVDHHPDTLLIVTADHETGGLNLEGVNSAEQLKDSLFTNLTAPGFYDHTAANVLVYAYGKGAKQLADKSIIDNTDIYQMVKESL